MPTVSKNYAGKVVGRRFFAIAPGADFLSPRPDALYVGTGGDVEVVDEEGITTVFVAVPTGAVLPISPMKVLATNTDAEDIVGLL